MKLPAADEAVVTAGKVRDYLLSPTHPIGRSKARVFRALGYTQADWERLRADLRALAMAGEATLVPATPLWTEVPRPRYY